MQHELTEDPAGLFACGVAQPTGSGSAVVPLLVILWLVCNNKIMQVEQNK